jgi:hypothetical protein
MVKLGFPKHRGPGVAQQVGGLGVVKNGEPPRPHQSRKCESAAGAAPRLRAPPKLGSVAGLYLRGGGGVLLRLLDLHHEVGEAERLDHLHNNLKISAQTVGVDGQPQLGNDPTKPHGSKEVASAMGPQGHGGPVQLLGNRARPQAGRGFAEFSGCRVHGVLGNFDSVRGRERHRHVVEHRLHRGGEERQPSNPRRN